MDHPDWEDPATDCRRGAFNAPSTFLEPPAVNFAVRGANYLTDRVKVPSARAMFRPIGVHPVTRASGPAFHAAECVPSLAAHLRAHPDSFFFLVNWVLPGPPHRAAIFAFERQVPRGVDPAFDLLLDEFVTGDEEQRRNRLKYFPQIKHAPWLVMQGVRSMGAERPTMLCRKLATRCHNGPNYCEVDVDVGSSSIANAVTNLLLPALSSVTIEHAFIMEGLTAAELPERVLGCMRIQQADIAFSTIPVD